MDKKNKGEYIEQLKQDYDELQNDLEVLKREVTSKEEQDDREELNLDTKFSILEDRLNQMRWRIDNFQRSETAVDEIVMNSFAELEEEIDWRVREVQAGLRGKEVWESEEAAKKGRKAFGDNGHE